MPKPQIKQDSKVSTPYGVGTVKRIYYSKESSLPCSAYVQVESELFMVYLADCKVITDD